MPRFSGRRMERTWVQYMIHTAGGGGVRWLGVLSAKPNFHNDSSPNQQVQFSRPVSILAAHASFSAIAAPAQSGTTEVAHGIAGFFALGVGSDPGLGFNTEPERWPLVVPVNVIAPGTDLVYIAGVGGTRSKRRVLIGDYLRWDILTNRGIKVNGGDDTFGVVRVLYGV